MASPPIPAVIAEVLARHGAPAQAMLLQVRDLIFAVSAETEGVGTLTETLKWGEPAYLTEASRSGTTIRLGISKVAPADCAMFFNCRTGLIDSFRTHFADAFNFEGNRALIIAVNGPLPREPLALCVRAALLYHRRSRVLMYPVAY